MNEVTQNGFAALELQPETEKALQKMCVIDSAERLCDIIYELGSKK